MQFQQQEEKEEEEDCSYTPKVAAIACHPPVRGGAQLVVVVDSADIIP
jgi:hypothetical protein